MITINGRNAKGDAVRIVIDGGRARAIYSDAIAPVMAALGDTQVERASHVEPYDGSGEFPAVYRQGTWWTADMRPSNGPVLGPFATRQAALDAELAWLRTHEGL